jgi:hypothetical protein
MLLTIIAFVVLMLILCSSSPFSSSFCIERFYIMIRRRPIYLLSVGLLASSLEAFHPSILPRQLLQQRQRLPRAPEAKLDRLHATSKNYGGELPPNEFSRTVQPERILKSRRDFMIDLEATVEERQALASRFDLTEIDALKASLALRPESQRTTGVEVEGTVTASVTQTCVRTNEQFQVDLEFPLYCVVRPVRPISQLVEESSSGMGESRSSQKSTPNNKKTKYRPQDRSIEEMDMLELQKLLQEDISSEESVLMEDEAIYSTASLLDVGELVSQLFWLQLDPYPKKPGSEPVQRSITG